MVNSQASQPIVRFGPFEIDRTSGELRKNGLRIRIQDQPLQVLSALLEAPGELVTREELIRRLWSDGTFVDFDRGLNAAVARLRQVLQDSAETPRYVETLPGKGYRFIARLESHRTETSSVEVPPKPKRRKLWHILAVAGVAVASLAAAWVVKSRSGTGIVVLEQVTHERGLALDPALSPDGKLLAYASDRADGHLNIWVRQLDRQGATVQLTHEDVNARHPAFSPDGTKVVFRSERDGGGLYVVPAIGGKPELLFARGKNPRFSPDGRRIAFCIGSDKGAEPEHDCVGQIFVAAASGGTPVQVGRNLPPAVNPIWSPDSSQLLVLADPADMDWWVVPLEGEARKTGLFAKFRALAFPIQPPYLRPGAWLKDRLVFSAVTGDERNLWQIPFRAADATITGRPERVTQGTNFEVSPSVHPVAGLAFSSIRQMTGIWSIPVEANEGRVTGQLQRITEGDAWEVSPSLSANGEMLTYRSRVPHEGFWFRNLRSGGTAMIAGTAARRSRPVISRDGAQVAYNIPEGKEQGLFVASTTDGTSRRVLTEPAYVHGWRPDDGALLTLKPTPNRAVRLLDLKTGAQSDFLAKAGWSIYDPSYSPDGKWITLAAGLGEGPSMSESRVYVLRADSREAAHWIQVAVGHVGSSKPRWSPDGNTLYFLSNQDGFRCIWAQPLQPGTKEPKGEPIPFSHFHETRLSPQNVSTTLLEMDVAERKLVIVLSELTGNIWMRHERN